METRQDIQHLITKNWFYTILLGSLLIAARMTEVPFVDPDYSMHISPLWVVPTWLSVLVSSIILSLPAFLVAQNAIMWLMQFKPGTNAARYLVMLMLLSLIWGTGAILFPGIFPAAFLDDPIFGSLCIYSFSAAYFFTSDSDLMRAIEGKPTSE